MSRKQSARSRQKEYIMSKAVTLNGIGIKYTEEYVNKSGWRVEHVVYDVPNRSVELLRYNGDSSAVVVSVNGRAAQMPLKHVDGWIKNRI